MTARNNLTPMKLAAVDLFSGGGGLSLGFLNAGFTISAAFDCWDPAIALYKENFKSHPIFKCDLSSPGAYKRIKKYAPNIIIGGPPCQDFSSAGKRDETLGRADLTVAFAGIVSKVKPRFFVMENVERAAKSAAFGKARRIFKEAGYGMSVRVLDASRCGAPQIRKRLFVIGERGGKDGFLDEALDKNLSQVPMTLRDYFEGRLGVEHYYRHPRSYARRGVFSIDEPSPTVRGVNRPIPAGYPGHPGDTAPVNGDVRPLTTKERSMIQTFPSGFSLVGSKCEVEQIIGNAVPVKLAEYVAMRLLEYLAASGMAESKSPARPSPREANRPGREPKISMLLQPAKRDPIP